jgi:hypothetical protein
MAKRLKKEAPDPARMPTAEQLQKLMQNYSAKMAQMATLRGDIGAMLKQAQHDFNVNLPAFKSQAKLMKMDETKRAEIATHEAFYAPIFGTDKQPDMFSDDTPGVKAAEPGKGAKAASPRAKKAGAAAAVGRVAKKLTGKDAAANQGDDDFGDDDVRPAAPFN